MNTDDNVDNGAPVKIDIMMIMLKMGRRNTKMLIVNS